MTIQTEDIVNKEFSRSFLGYDMQEVDVFLDAIIDRVDKLESQRRELILAMEYLLKKLEHNGELSEGVKRTLGSSDRALRRLVAAAERSAPDARAEGKFVKGHAGVKPDSREKRKPDEHKKQAKPKKPVAELPDRRTETPIVSAHQPINDPISESEKAAVNARIQDAAVPGARAPLRVGYAKPVEQPGADTTQDAPIVLEIEPAAQQDFAGEPVAIEMEQSVAGGATELDLLIPELLSDLESALSDEAIRAASDIGQDAIVRAGEGRVV